MMARGWAGVGWRGVVGGWVDFLLPPACAGCGGSAGEEVRAGEGPVCRNCRMRLPRVPLPVCDRCGAPLGTGAAPSCLECADWPELLGSAHAASLLESPARELVHALKYQGWRGAGHFMGVEMARRAGEEVRRAHHVVPVPTSRRNLQRRGYNQAEVIAIALAAALDLPLLHCLERPSQKGTQTALNPMQRRANVSGAFAVAGGFRDRLAGQRLLLVDDVITTSATIVAAARALESGGPETVIAYAFSRTVPISLDSN
ncbi:MAG: ComF family protein [Gemmatimonadota bacterium]|nr:ComF family protein [Gemmatimonadota bacterium]